MLYTKFMMVYRQFYSVRQTVTLVGLLGIGWIAAPSVSYAQAFIEELPPPPPHSFGQPLLPQAPELDASPAELEFSASNSIISPNLDSSFSQSINPINDMGGTSVFRFTDGGGGSTFAPYRVLVNGNSASMLSQVKRVVPDAFITNYTIPPSNLSQSIIQAGAFESPANANDRLRVLQNSGINGFLVTLGSEGNYSAPSNTGNTGNTGSISSTGGDINFGIDNGFDINSGFNPPVDSSLPSNLAIGNGFTNQTLPKAYYVVIPILRDQVANTLTSLQGVVFDSTATPRYVVGRTTPHGPHVAIGPYASYGSAAAANQRVRTNGFDSQVYYGQ